MNAIVEEKSLPKNGFSLKIRGFLDIAKKLFGRYGILALFFIFAFTASGYINEKSFDNQEIDYLRISQLNVREIIFENYGDQLPLWFIFAKFYINIFGKSEISLKILSVGAFLLSAFVLYKLCEIYKLNKYLITALFLFNPLLLKEIAVTFKHWPFLILISLLVLYFFEKYKNTRRKKYLILLFIATGAGMYSNLIFLVFLSAFIVYLITNFLSEQISFKLFVFFLIVCAFLSLPLLYYFGKAEHQLIDVQGSHMDWGVSARGFDFIKMSLSRAIGSDYLDNALFSDILIFLFLLLFLIQFFLEREKKFVYLKVWLISTVFFIMLVMMIMAGKTPVANRYFAMAVPFLYLAIFPRTIKKNYAFAAILSISIIIFSLTAFSSWQMAKNSNFDNWKGVASFLQPKIKENTQIIILYKFNVGNLLMEYYLKKPVTRLLGLNSGSVLYSDDIWIIKHRDAYETINKITDKYIIKEYNNFKPIKIFHLSRKNPKENNSLIFSNPFIEIEKDKKIQKIQFSNGASSAWNLAEDWQQIQISAIKSGGVEKLCLFAHPRDNGKINITYKNIELDKAIRVVSGIADNMAGGNSSPVYMDVYIDGSEADKIIQSDKYGWQTSIIDTSQYKKKQADVKFIIYADDYLKRHFCFDAEPTDGNDYFYRNIKDAKAATDGEPCDIYQENPIFPHNEKKPPFGEAAIYERWDCEKDLISKNKIWNTIGKSYAVSDNEFKEAIWFHPEADKTKTLEYNGINKEAAKIVGFYGLNDLSFLNKISPTMTFMITANGEKIYEDEFVPVKGWKNFEIPFNKKLENAVFSITTSDNRWNHFFFNAFLE